MIQKAKITALIFLVMNACIVEMRGFNNWYYGTDAHESFAGMGYDPRFVAEDYIKYFPYYQHYVENMRFIHPAQIDIATLPYPYNILPAIEPYNGSGYYVNGQFVAKLFASNNIVNAIEIGSDFGLSTRHIASLLPENGMLYAIDMWSCDREGFDTHVYFPFLSNIAQTGLTDKIIPIRRMSQDFIDVLKLLRSKFDLIYVDGDHETEGVARDLELYFPLLSNHGVMCGDDWLLKTVRAGVIQFAQKHNLTIYGACNFWFIRDEGSYQQKDFLEADENIWIF